MGRVEENKKKKKEALFRTAYELFTTKGINSTAISDIVEKAGVAKGTFYLYFKDKYDRKTVMIPNGVNKPCIKPVNVIKEKYTLEKDEYILFLGRLVPEKGI